MSNEQAVAFDSNELPKNFRPGSSNQKHQSQIHHKTTFTSLIHFYVTVLSAQCKVTVQINLWFYILKPVDKLDNTWIRQTYSMVRTSALWCNRICLKFRTITRYLIYSLSFSLSKCRISGKKCGKFEVSRPALAKDTSYCTWNALPCCQSVLKVSLSLKIRSRSILIATL
jgi:hypothetical protein